MTLSRNLSSIAWGKKMRIPRILSDNLVSLKCFLVHLEKQFIAFLQSPQENSKFFFIDIFNLSMSHCSFDPRLSILIKFYLVKKLVLTTEPLLDSGIIILYPVVIISLLFCHWPYFIRFLQGALYLFFYSYHLLRDKFLNLKRIRLNNRLFLFFNFCF